MTMNINTLKQQTNDGQILYGDSLAAIIDRSPNSPDDVIYNVDINKKGSLQMYKDGGGYESIDLQNDSQTNKLDTENILSATIDGSKDSDGNDVYTFHKYNGKIYDSIVVPKLNTQSGLNKDLVLYNIVLNSQDDEKTVYNVINYNGNVVGEPIVVYKAPTITHLQSKDVLSNVVKDGTNTDIDKYNILKYDQTTAMTIESNKVKDGIVGQYDKIKNVLSKDVNINGLTNENFDPLNIYIPTTFEYGKSESDSKDYIGYYVADKNDKYSTNMLLSMSSNGDNKISINDIMASYNTSYVQNMYMSNYTYNKTQDGKSKVFNFGIRSNEINNSAGGYFYFDLILANEGTNSNTDGQIFPTGKYTTGKIYRSQIDSVYNKLNPFKLFSLDYEVYNDRKIKYADEFIGHEIVMMKDVSISDNIKEVPVHLTVKFKLTKQTDASKDMIEIITEVHSIFSDKGSIINSEPSSYTLEDKGIVIEMHRYH